MLIKGRTYHAAKTTGATTTVRSRPQGGHDHCAAVTPCGHDRCGAGAA